MRDKCAMPTALLQRTQPEARETRPRLGSRRPDLLEVGCGCVVLRDGDSHIEVENDMPPAARHEDRLARLLHEIDTRHTLTLELRQHLVEPDHSLPTHAARWLDNVRRNVRCEQHPPLVAAHQHVPR